MIKIDQIISAADKAAILGIYEQMVANDEVDQLGYVNNKIYQKIAVMESSEFETDRYIAAYAKIMFELLKQGARDSGYLEYNKCILSALYYLCDPYDYFPDLHHKYAYIDDALVLNQCLELLKEQGGNTYKHICNFIRDSKI